MKIVALGGGAADENTAVDKKIVELTGKENPNFLFLPTASGDGGRYINTVKRIYKRMGCRPDALCLLRADYEYSELTERISAADIIYAGGGNTIRMMKTWSDKNILPLLTKAAEKGTVMCGTSAGAMCWFSYGYSDCDFDNPEIENPSFRLLDGLGLINAILCPHYNDESRKNFDSDILNYNLPGIALENDSALVFDNGNYSIVKNNSESKAFLFDNIGKRTEITGDFSL